MSNLPSQQPEAPTCEALSDDELQAVSGGAALVIGRGALVLGRDVAFKIKPFNCGACVQGVPRDLVTNPAFNQLVRAGF
jgi:bacteriocin-like protein